MGMGLPAGGHLTHGWNVSITGKYFRAVAVRRAQGDRRIDLDEVRELAQKEQPKLLWCGGTAIPRTIDFAAFADIANEVGAILVADIAHIAGLVAGGAHPSPVPHRRRRLDDDAQDAARPARRHAHVQGGSTRGAIDQAVFPGLQGGPHNHTTAGIAVALKEAATDAFKKYAHAHRRERQGARRGADRARLRSGRRAAPTTTSSWST